jgi:ketosteroid isomerase-like protein
LEDPDADLERNSRTGEVVLLNPREQTMKIPFVITLVGLAISFALQTFAQEQNTVDPEVRQQIEAALKEYDAAFNKHDAAAIAALFTQDAIEELGWESEGGAVFGQQAIEKRYTVELAGGMNNHVIKLVQAYPIGSEVCAITKETVAQWTNSAVRIYVRDADTWKIKLAYVISTMTH